MSPDGRRRSTGGARVMRDAVIAVTMGRGAVVDLAP
jgi:hypothetical protein